MSISRRIYVSMPADQWLMPNQNDLKWGIVEEIESLGYKSEIIAVHLRIFWLAGLVLANPKRPVIPESPDSLSEVRTVRTVLSGQI
jgi:hypothetical protein